MSALSRQWVAAGSRLTSYREQMAHANVPDLDVLIVEDNASLSQSLCKFLVDQGIDAEAVDGIAEGIARVEACTIRLALVSTGLPGGGVEACRRIRSLSGRKPMVLMLSTTRPTGRVIKDAQGAGAEGVAQKMGGPRAILDRVRKLLPGVGAASRLSKPAGGAAPPAAAGGRPRPRPAAHPNPLRAARERPVPRGVQVDGRMKPKVAEALSNLKRRQAQTDLWDRPGAAAGGGSDDLLSSDPLFATGGGGHGGLSRAEEEHGKGLADFEAKRYDDALQRFINAWSLEPSTPIFLAYKIRTQALLADSPPDPDGDMGDDLRMAALLDPKLVAPPLFLGHMYVAAGRPADARKHFKAVLDLEPGHADAKAALTRIVNQA